jgi:hypothetical protein
MRHGAANSPVVCVRAKISFAYANVVYVLDADQTLPAADLKSVPVRQKMDSWILSHACPAFHFNFPAFLTQMFKPIVCQDEEEERLPDSTLSLAIGIWGMIHYE